jgi:hypothetical protein
MTRDKVAATLDEVGKLVMAKFSEERGVLLGSTTVGEVMDAVLAEMDRRVPSFQKRYKVRPIALVAINGLDFELLDKPVVDQLAGLIE